MSAHESAQGHSRDFPPPPCVYLSGAIEAAPDGGREWRFDIARFLTLEMGHKVLWTEGEQSYSRDEDRRSIRDLKGDPAQFGKLQEILQRFIRRDLKMIEDQADYVIAYWDCYAAQGAGTQGEITLAFHRGIPVYLVLGMFRSSVSAWILGCSLEVFDSFSLLRKRFLQLRGDPGAFRRRMLPYIR